MIGLVISGIVIVVLFIIYKFTNAVKIKLIALILSLIFLIPNGIALLIYIASPKVQTIKGIVVNKEDSKPVPNVNLVIKYKNDFYTIVQSSTNTSEINLTKTDYKGKFTFPSIYKPLPSVVPPFYIEWFKAPEITVYDPKYIVLTIELSDSSKLSNLNIAVSTIKSGDDFIGNTTKVYYEILGGDVRLNDAANLFLKTAMKYYEEVFSGYELTKTNNNALSFLYEKCGDKQKANQYMQKYLAK